MSFARYPEYKDSGVEWLGEVPAHWEVLPLKRVSPQQTVGIVVNPSEYITDEGLPFIYGGDISEGRIDYISSRRISPENSQRNEKTCLKAGDLLTVRVGAPGITAVVPPECEGGNCASVMLVRRGEFNSDWLCFVMNSRAVRYQVEIVQYGAAQEQFNINHAVEFVVSKPPRTEQDAIATFLDRETAKIDTLVAEQEKLIALLQEKRQAVISHAVTKGLDPNVPMKDSGVEWLGEVPAHWEVLPLKRISPQQTVGIVVNPSEYLSDEGLPFIYGGNVTEGRIDHISSRRISPEDSQRNEKTRLKAGDLITVRVGAPGITAVVPPECEGGNCASVMLVRQGEFNSDWLCFVMNSRVVRYQVEIVQYGAAQQQFNINHAVEFVIPQPPRAEQDALASFLTSETTRLGNLEAEARTAIALLQERRTALISAAVTGQIDVRGLAGSANAPDSVAASAYPASA